METLEERFPFLFNKQADYNTNSPSYYDGLAKYNKVLQILAKMIEEYDEKLDNSLENINTVLTNYTTMLDGKLAGFDNSVMLLLREWIDDGTFEMIINTEIFNHKLDTSTFNAYKENADSVALSFSEHLVELYATKAEQSELLVEKARIDSFTTLSPGSTTGDAELIDGRIGQDSQIYSNIGGAMRIQLDKLKNSIYDMTTNERLVRVYPFIGFEQGGIGRINGYYNPNNDPVALPIRLRANPQKINYEKITIYAADGYQFAWTTYNYDGSNYVNVFDSGFISSATIEIDSTKYYALGVKKLDGSNVIHQYVYNYISIVVISDIYEKLAKLETTCFNDIYKKLAKLETNRFNDMNVLFIGDSITENNFTATKNWTKNVSEWCGFNASVNKAVGGTGIIRPRGGLNWYDNVSNYGDGHDIILIMGNMNDFSDPAYFNENKIGSFGDDTLATQYGAVRLFIEKLITKYPTSKIGWITSTPRQYTQPDGDNSNPVRAAGYLWGKNSVFEKANKAIIDTCEHYSIPVLDLFHCSNLKPHSPENVSEYYYDVGNAVHPNNNGHLLIARSIYAFIQSNF